MKTTTTIRTIIRGGDDAQAEHRRHLARSVALARSEEMKARGEKRTPQRPERPIFLCRSLTR